MRTLSICLIFFLVHTGLEAVPTFAKNLGVDCSTCHTAYPQLAEFGKIFLESAGDMLIQKDFGSLSMVAEPFSGHAYMVPINKPFSIDSIHAIPRRERELRIHALEEGDIYMAGSVGKFFYYTVFEADNEDNFSVYISEFFAAYRFSKYINFFGGYASPFKIDANDTVWHPSPLYREWKAADYVPGISEMLGMNFEIDHFHGILSWHGDRDEFEGIDPKNFSLRLAYDWGHQTFGTYYSYGKFFDDDEGRCKNNFQLWGVDAHLRFQKTNIMMLLGFRSGHNRKVDFDFSIEANTRFLITDRCIKKYLPFFIPIGNIDIYVDRTLARGTWIKGSGGIAFYFNPAVRIFPQFIGTILAPSCFKHKEYRAVITLDIGI